MTDDDRHDETELRGAAALAEALERRPEQRIGAADAADALDAAELISASRRSQLSQARVDEVLRDVHARIDAQRVRRRRRVLGLTAVTGALAAAAAALLMLTRPMDAPSRSEPVARVPDSAHEESAARHSAVLAQRAWLSDASPANRIELRERIAQYRATHIGALDRRLPR